MRDRTILCGSASKSYSMTGWRCGWTVGPARGDRGLQRASEPLDVERLLDLAEGGARRGHRTAGLRRRRCSTNTASAATQLHAWLTADPRIKCVKPDGAFYLFIDISALLSPDGIRTSAEFAEQAAARGATSR